MGLGCLLGAALVGGFAKAAAPNKTRVVSVLGLSAQLNPKHGTIYRGNLQLVMSSDYRKILGFRYLESTKNVLTLKNELYSTDFAIDGSQGTRLMEFTSKPVVVLKTERMNSSSGGAITLLLTRDQKKGDTRALHLKLSRACGNCAFTVEIDENGERGLTDQIHFDIDGEVAGVRRIAIARSGNRKPLVLRPEEDLRYVAR